MNPSGRFRSNIRELLPCILRLWKRGEPKKEFLMVCRRVLHGMFCIEGESGGVCAGGSMEGTFRGGNFGLFIGDTAGLTLCKLFFRLQNTGTLGVSRLIKLSIQAQAELNKNECIHESGFSCMRISSQRRQSNLRLLHGKCSSGSNGRSFT